MARSALSARGGGYRSDANNVSSHRECVRIRALRRWGLINDNQPAGAGFRPEFDAFRVVCIELIRQLGNNLDPVGIDNIRDIVMHGVPPAQDEGRSLQGHGRPDQEEQIVAVQTHISDAKTTGVKKMLSIASFPVVAPGREAASTLLDDLQVEHDGVSPEHGPAKAEPHALASHLDSRRSRSLWRGSRGKG
jgi:hypothetical protein